MPRAGSAVAARRPDKASRARRNHGTSARCPRLVRAEILFMGNISSAGPACHIIAPPAGHASPELSPMRTTEFDDPRFLARSRQGDAAAYRLLVRRFHASLVR